MAAFAVPGAVCHPVREPERLTSCAVAVAVPSGASSDAAHPDPDPHYLRLLVRMNQPKMQRKTISAPMITKSWGIQASWLCTRLPYRQRYRVVFLPLRIALGIFGGLCLRLRPEVEWSCWYSTSPRTSPCPRRSLDRTCRIQVRPTFGCTYSLPPNQRPNHLPVPRAAAADRAKAIPPTMSRTQPIAYTFSQGKAVKCTPWVAKMMIPPITARASEIAIR